MHPESLRAAVLHGIIDDETGKIRLEHASLNYRTQEDERRRWSPHAGGVTVNPNYSYQYHDGRIYSGMTRIVWELNGVEKGQGGTAFIPGSHKSNFRKKLDRFDDPDSADRTNKRCVSHVCKVPGRSGGATGAVRRGVSCR